MILAAIAGAKLPPIILCLGVVKQFKDLADKAKARNKIDDNYTDKSTLPQELVSYVELTVGGELSAPKLVEKVRTDLLKLRSTVCGMLENRLNGKDIGTTGAKQDFDEESAIAELFGTVDLETVEIPTGETTAPIIVEGGTFLALDWLVCRVYEAGKSGDGKQEKSHLKLFANSVLATALALASNDEKRVSAIVNESVQRVDGETIEEHSQRVLQAREEVLASPTIDMALVEKVMSTLTSTSIELKATKDKTEVVSYGGPLGEVLKELVEFNSTRKAATTEKRLIYAATSIPAMSSVVQLVKNIDNDDSGSIFTKYPTKSSPEFRCFGGLDVGYIDRKDRKKASE
jgi:hypothetical protein